MAEMKQPSDLPKARKHKSMYSDEDDEEPHNETRTSSNSQPIAPVLLLHQGAAASSQGPAAFDNSADEDSEYSDEYSARSQDSRRTVFYPDLHVLTNDEHWTVTPETHKYAAAAGSFSFVTTENEEQQDACNLITMPCVQRSLYLNEVTNDSGSTNVEISKRVDSRIRDTQERCMATCRKTAGARAKMRSRARKEASAEEVRGYYEQFAEARHLEYKPWVYNEVFDLIDIKKIEQKMLPDDGCSPSRRTNRVIMCVASGCIFNPSFSVPGFEIRQEGRSCRSSLDEVLAVEAQMLFQPEVTAIARTCTKRRRSYEVAATCCDPKAFKSRAMYEYCYDPERNVKKKHTHSLSTV